MAIYLKINALIPSERSKPCPHEYFGWTGRIPSTGRVRCPMCGTSWNSMIAAEQAQQQMRAGQEMATS